ncbi:putative ABC transporter permease subunit [Oceanobacillus sp. 1P07AA]|uniref:putative ABC transporter permease subunit n=1 Tax=Oceanobacillus sp. 1P07AA TaxID=3132293 RepID=UPI0039A48D23
MSKTWKVIRIMLKMQYTSTSKNNYTWLYIVAGIFFIPFLGMIFTLYNNLISAIYNVFAPLQQQSMILGLLFIGMSIILFITCIISVLTAFYFADDVEAYIPFPLHPYQILIGKAATPLIYSYMLSGITYLPMMIIYGNISNGPLLYYIYGILLFILLPIIPFVIASVILMFVMRYVNIAKNKDRSKIFAGVFSLAAVILLNVVVRLNTDESELMESIGQTMQEQEGLLQWITYFYPPAWFSANSLHQADSITGFLFLLFMFILSGLAILLFAFLGQKLYLKGVLGMSGGSSGKMSDKALDKSIASQPIWKSYIKKDLRILFRTPTFLTQCVVQSLFMPVFLLVIFFLDFGSGAAGEITGSVPENNVLLLLFIVTVFMGSINMTAATSISREGKTWRANLFLPLNHKQVIHSKLIVSWIIGLLPMILLFVIGIIIEIPVKILILWGILFLAINWFSSCIGIILDMNQPKLNWTDEQELFKNRFVPFFGFLMQGVIFGLITIVLWNIDVSNVYLLAVILFAVISLGVFLAHRYMYKRINQHVFQEINF